jgi:protein SCO1
LKGFRLAASVALVATLLAAPAGAGGDTTHSAVAPRPASGLGKADLQAVGFDQHLGDIVPLDAPFLDESGRPVRLGDAFGERPVVLALVYNECPMLCSLVLQGLVGSLRAVSTDAGKDFDVVVVSFDPKDTPETARKKKDIYVKRYGRPTGERGFHFLTGDASSIARVTSSVGFNYRYDDKIGQFAHPAGIVVLTKSGKIARYLFGAEFSPKDLGFALADASDGKVGSFATQLLMLCYRYDPVQGTYSATAMGAVRAGGAATLFALGGFVALSLVRERRRRRRAGAEKGEARS